jgi:hypothetical protein
MKFREHRGSYDGSMATTVEIDPTKEAIAKHLGLPAKDIIVLRYVFDARNGWDTHSVTNDSGVLGFTDGPINE